jgi:hypothetical protein
VGCLLDGWNQFFIEGDSMAQCGAVRNINTIYGAAKN